MTMHKRRDPRSFDGGIARVIGNIGADACAKAISTPAAEKTTSLVRKWADPDTGNLPTLAQALALDLANMKDGDGTAPILQAYTGLVERLGADLPKPVEGVHESILDVNTALGCLSNIAKRATCPNGPGGKAITPNEAAELHDGLHELIRQAKEVAAAVDGASTLNVTAIPVKGKIS